MDEKLKLELLSLASLTKEFIKLELCNKNFISGVIEEVVPGFVYIKIDHAGRSCVVPVSINVIKDIL